MTKIRQPIITVCGHVDHGKTSLLDKIRGTSVAEKEAGRITQKISFTELPKEIIEKRSEDVLKKFKIPLEIPGFLFIDTPGHAAFTNLRKRGGSLADLAILVIDINEGIKPQTSEVLQILKANKTPFIIALNKIDNISGWQANAEQAPNVQQNFEEKLYTLIGALNLYKFDTEIYSKIKDFTKKVAIVPCSARTGEGIKEILAVLVALSQKFLKQRIEIGKKGKGVILEVKKEKSINFLESILHDGKLSTKNEIVIASFGEPIISRIRNIQQALPLSKGFKNAEEVQAATGIRLQIIAKEEILPGMPFQVLENDLEKIKKEFKQELSEEIKTDNSGIIAKADSLGSLEALLTLLKQNNIKVIKAEIGDITKKDIYIANSLPEEDRVILGFNIGLAEDVEPGNIKIILNPVVYKIIEDYDKWKQEKISEIEKGKLEKLVKIGKIKILPFVFRNSNPAIFGVKVEAGSLVHGTELINLKGEKIGRVKGIQEEKTKLHEAKKGKEIAISIPGMNFDRQLKEGEVLYSNISEFHFRKFKENKELLSADEKSILQEIAEIKRKEDVTWGV